MLETLRPLALKAQHGRKTAAPGTTLRTDDIRAAVEHAVELELPRFLDELTQKVLTALGH